jgi:photosystem II stability/assembly factor-like uncharacterized protein
MGGRLTDLAVVESNPAIFYVGSATGGVWKTTNRGTTFEPVFDDEVTASVGDVTVAPSNPNVVWVGTGEPQNRQSSPWGNGVYKSTDAGKTWQYMGLAETHHISRIVVHHNNPDVAYVAAVGRLWGASPERGVYKTTDGGRSWDLVLFVDDNTGTIDLVMDPGDPETLFAAMYQRRRTGYGFNGGGPGSGIYRTTDSGANWQELTEGLPEGDMGRIGLGVYRGDGNLVFALVEARPGQGVYRSIDRGETWERLSETNNRPMYYSQIWIDPNDPERIYLGGANMYRSSDGGRTFTSDAARGVHSDHHALWIDPANSNHLILGGDGGLSVSWDRSDHWRQLTNMALAQFYEIGVDMRDPYYVCGGLQDNGSWCGPSNTLSSQGIRNKDWYNVGGGDGFYTVIDPTDHAILFAESQGGNLLRMDLTTMERTFVRPVARPDDNGEVPDRRFNWDSPVVMSARDPQTIYFGGNVLFKSADRGFTWDIISPDLTKQIDRDTLEIMGRQLSERLLSRNDGISTYGNLTRIAESPLNRELIYVGTDDGNVQITRDGGANWTDLTSRLSDVPNRTYVSRLVASRHAEGRVYVTFDGHRNNDFQAYVYVSEDYGNRWRPLNDGLPDGWSVNAFAEHPRNADLLFVGNEVGIYFSVDRGENWTRLKNNLPTVPVDDIVVHPRDNDLVIGTHGRGAWIMDDISPLEDLTRETVAADAHLFPVRTATSFNPYTPQGWTPGEYVAPNPSAGARFRYWLKQDASDTLVKLTVRDAAGRLVRELDGPGELGSHEVIWDLRHPRPYEPDPEQQSGFSGAPRGPRVLPGRYAVSLETEGGTMMQEFDVRLDPRVQISRADLEARQRLMMSMYALAKPLYEAGRAIQRLTQQVSDVQKLLRDREDLPESLTDEVTAVSTELGEIGGELNQARRASRTAGRLEASTTPPAPDYVWQVDRAWDEIPGLIERLNLVITTRMPALYDQLNELGVRPAIGEPVPVPVRP